MKTIIAGGRSYVFTPADVKFLDSLIDEISEVVSGAAAGADQHAETWARRNGIPVQQFVADWQRHGRAAGPIRNKHMAQYAAGGMCILFPGGKGTANMRRAATTFGLKVIESSQTGGGNQR